MDFYNNRNLRRNYRRSKQRLPENLNNRICCVLYMLNVTFVVLVEIWYVLQRQKRGFTLTSVLSAIKCFLSRK